MLNAAFLWRQASSPCSLLLFHCLLADEANHRDALLQCWDEGWGRLEDDSASRVMKRLGGKQWTGADHVYSVKAVKSQNTVQVRPGHVWVSVSVRVFIACACRPEGWRCVTEWDWRASKFLHFYGESCQLFTFHGLSGPAHEITGPSKKTLILRVAESDWHDILSFFFFLRKAPFSYLSEVLSVHVLMFTFFP